MADSTLDVKDCYLIPGRFGPPNLHIFGGLLGGVTGSTHHNVASAEFDVGTVMSVLNKGTTAGSRVGMCEFVYGQFVQDEGSAAFAMAAGQTCISASNAGAAPIPTFTNYADHASGSLFMGQEDYAPFGVIAISVMTIDRYGWFWCGGSGPEDFVGALTAYVIITSNAVVEGPFATADMATAGELGIGPYDDSVATSAMSAVGGTGGKHYVPMGFCLAAADSA